MSSALSWRTTVTDTDLSSAAYAANSGLACGVAPQEREGVRVLPCHGQERPGAEAAAGRQRQLAAELLAEVVEDLLEDLSVELFLRPEVPVDDELGDPARRGHVLHGGVREPRGCERPRRAVEDGGTTFGPGEQLAFDLYTGQYILGS